MLYFVEFHHKCLGVVRCISISQLRKLHLDNTMESSSTWQLTRTFDLQGAGPGSAGRQPWTDEAIRLTINSGIGTLRLAAAEAEADLRDTRQSNTAPGSPAYLPPMLRRRGAELLQAATRGITPDLARTFANDGMAHALMDVRGLSLENVPGASHIGTLARSYCIHEVADRVSGTNARSWMPVSTASGVRH